jgi:hypothetical protein
MYSFVMKIGTGISNAPFRCFLAQRLNDFCYDDTPNSGVCGSEIGQNNVSARQFLSRKQDADRFIPNWRQGPHAHLAHFSQRAKLIQVCVLAALRDTTLAARIRLKNKVTVCPTRETRSRQPAFRLLQRESHQS